jgi:hypothetical protein
MEILTTYFNKEKMAKVSISEGLYFVEYFIDGKLMNKTAHNSMETAESLAEGFTSIGGTEPTFLSENV